MPLSDVKVRITTVKPLGTVGFGKPLIVAEKAGGHPYTEYLDLEGLAADFAEGTEVHKMAKALLSQSNRPARFAVAAYDPASVVVGESTTAADLVEELLGQDWYFLLAEERDPISIGAIADVIEAGSASGLPKLYSTQVPLASDLAGFGELDRTFVAVHSDEERIDAAIVGAVGSREVGSVTWQGKTLEGITPRNLSATELNAIEIVNAYVYVTKAGDPVTSEGKVMSGEYIDVMHGMDWVKANIEQTVQQIKNRSGKIPYTDAGIATLEAGVINVLKRGYNQGLIADDGAGNPLYSTNFIGRDEMSKEDIALRRYTGGKFTFELAGAIHTAEINGSVSY